MNPRRPARLHACLGRVAVAGAATLATVLATSPAAVADDDIAPESSSSEAETTPEPVGEDAPAVEDAPADDQAPVEDTPAEPAPEPVAPLPTSRVAQSVAELAEAAEPAFLDQSVTVSARIEGGYSDGVTTAGTVFQVVVTDTEGTPTTTSCTTDTDTLANNETFCLFDDGEGGTRPELLVPAGSSITVTLVSAPQDLTVSGPSSVSAEPSTDSTGQSLQIRFLGPGPVANTDFPETDQNVPVDIDVTDNDDNVGPDATVVLDADTPPNHGTVELIARPGDTPVVRYTPNEDFSGGDEFGYTVTTPLGTSFALVEVQVNADPVITPSFGSQKYRVGVQIADGSYVPAGTTTVGSTFSIVTTNQDGETVSTTTCTTVPVYSPTPIPIPGSDPQGASECGDFFNGYARAAAGNTVTIEQITAPANLVPSDQTVVIPPCEIDVIDACSFNVQTASFEDTGSILPETTDDTAATDAGEPVDIDVLANDDSDDPNTSLSVDSQPDHGEAEVIGAPAPTAPSGDESDDEGPLTLAAASSTDLVLAAVAGEGTLAVRYTPDAGFSGIDTFTYALSNSNGSTTGQVSVTVRGGEVVDSTSASSGDSDGVLPDTGGPSASLLGLGALLVAAGGTLTARRRRGTPAGE
jgi:LPXTG-motif cell wall-anchored protein